MKRLIAVLLILLCVIPMTLYASASSGVEQQVPSQTVANVDQIPELLDMPKISSLASGAAGVVAKWQKVEGAVKYRLFRKEGSGSWEKVVDTTGVSFTDKKVASNHTYIYTVRCVSENGKKFMSDYDKAGKSVLYYASPSWQAIQNVYGGVSLKWKKPAGAVMFRVLRKTKTGSWKKLVDTRTISYLDRTAKSGNLYYYAVRCINPSSKSFISGYQKEKSITYVAAPKISSVKNSGLKLTIRWNKVAGATYYRVLYKSPGGSWKKLGDTKNTSLSYTHAAKTSTEIYTVRCMNAKKKFISGYDASGYRFTLTVLPTKASTNTTATKPSATSNYSASSGYVGNINTKVFHYKGCASERAIKAGNRVSFKSASEAKKAGYRECQKCNPK